MVIEIDRLREICPGRPSRRWRTGLTFTQPRWPGWSRLPPTSYIRTSLPRSAGLAGRIFRLRHSER